MQRNFYYNLFFVFLLLKGGQLGYGKEMTWVEAFIPLMAAFADQIAEGLGWKDSLKLWVLTKVIAFRVRRERRKLYRDLTKI